VSAEDGVEVRVRIPTLLPGGPRIPIEASSDLDPEPTGG
jgi:hypothetical protein